MRKRCSLAHTLSLSPLALCLSLTHSHTHSLWSGLFWPGLRCGFPSPGCSSRESALARSQPWSYYSPPLPLSTWMHYTVNHSFASSKVPMMAPHSTSLQKKRKKNTRATLYKGRFGGFLKSLVFLEVYFKTWWNQQFDSRGSSFWWEGFFLKEKNTSLLKGLFLAFKNGRH